MLHPMTDPREPRPVPRWLHAWAVLTAAFVLVVLVVGGLVTTFRVGMSDPVWPTEPWFLAVNGWTEPRPGFLIEHTHRLVAFAVGGLAIVLSLGLWYQTPRRESRVAGIIALVWLIAAFGQFHGQMMAQKTAETVAWPTTTIGQMVGGIGILLVLSVGGLVSRTPGAGVRLLGVVALVAVMIQGLLGGFRVKLNELIGPELAMYHGVFAQVVFGLLACLAGLTAKPLAERAGYTPEARRRAHRVAVLLVALIYLQIAWGAWVRHAGTPLSLRLHFLTAFVVTGVAVWLVRSLFAAGRPTKAWVLVGVLALQVALGVEAWMGKFSLGIFAVESEKITKMQAWIRTGHLLGGSLLLGATVLAAVRTRAGKAEEF
jgi:cytochrome c oxidase assembly protein subunit 15